MRKSFGGTVVLRDIDLDVAEHEVVVLIGASGSGKSTLLRCMNLLETVDDGTIHLDGEDITDPRVDADPVRRAHRHRVPVVQPVPAPDRAGQRHARAAPGARVAAGRGRGARPWRCWTGSGWPTRPATIPTGSPAASSSGSRSPGPWSTDPRLMLLDEVTCALDPELVGEVLDLIRDLRARA